MGTTDNRADCCGIPHFDTCKKVPIASPCSKSQHVLCHFAKFEFSVPLVPVNIPLRATSSEMSSAQSAKQDRPGEGELPLASCNGHGTLEMLEIITAFEKAGIDCCMVGVSALKFYGARRMRLVRPCLDYVSVIPANRSADDSQQWDLCVPTEKFQEAISLLKNDPFSQTCQEETIPAEKIMSLYDTFPRFRRLGVRGLHFRILSSYAAHVPCNPSSFRRSKMGVPYPKLHHFVQGRIDTRDGVDLADVIDGMDIPEEWAVDNLDLSISRDSRWAEWSNERLKRAQPDATFSLVSTHPINRKADWEKLVRSKQTRMGWKYPKEQYATRFRRHGSRDPTTLDRETV